MTFEATPDKTPVRGWLPWMVGLAAIWGCSFWFIAVGVREVHPAYFALGRVAAGAVTLGIVMGVMRQRLPSSLNLWWHFFVLGLFGAVLPWMLFGYGEQRIPSLLAGIWNGAVPLGVLPVAVLVFRTERFSAQRVVGLLIGFLGVLTVLGAWQTGGADVTGQLMVAGAVVCYSFAIPYQRRFVAGAPVSGVALSAGMLIAATIELAVLAPLITGSAPPAPGDLSFDAVGSMVAIGVLGSGLAFVLNLHLVRVIGASRSSMVGYLIPIFAIAVGVLALDEHLQWHQPVGALVVLTGVAVSQGVVRRRTRTARETVET